MSEITKKLSDEELVDVVLRYEEISKKARVSRETQNQENWELWNNKQDYSDKEEGMSTLFIPKIAIALEQIVSTIIQGLTGGGDSYFVIDDNGFPDDVFDPITVKKILAKKLAEAGDINKFSTAARYVALDSIVTAKVGSDYKTIPKWEAKRKVRFEEIEGETVARVVKVRSPKGEALTKWELALDVLPFDDFQFDPKGVPYGNGLFEMQTSERDLHNLKAFTEATEIYNKDKVDKVKDGFGRKMEDKSREADQGDMPIIEDEAFRNRVVIKEVWGDFIDKEGNLIAENAVLTIANDKYVIRDMEDNPRYDGESPFVTAALINNPRSPFGKAIVDAAAKLQIAYNELTNAVADGGFAEAQNVIVVNGEAITNSDDLADGISYGTTLVTDGANTGDVVRAVQTGRVPQGAREMVEKLESLLLEALFSNELKLGSLPPASTKATAIVEAQSSLAGVFATLVKIFEKEFLDKVIRKSWMTILENMDHPNFFDIELVSLLGAKKAKQIKDLKAEERFIKGAAGLKIRVNGVSGFLRQFRNFQKMNTLLQTISNSPPLVAAFQKKYSFDKLLGVVIKSIGVEESAIAISESEREAKQGVQSLINQASAQLGPETQPGNGNKLPPQQQDGALPPIPSGGVQSGQPS